MKALKWFSLIAAVMLCLYAAAAGTAQASDPSAVVAQGMFGSLHWELDERGTLTVTGEGKMENRGPLTEAWMPLLPEVRRVVIGNGITGIGHSAFYNSGSLEEVSIPEGVLSIGDWAFAMCPNLREIRLPSSLQAIGNVAFGGCSGLTAIQLPAGFTTMGISPFAACGNLERITVDPENRNFAAVDGILYSADMTEVIVCPAGKTDVIIPEGVTTIGYGAYQGCAGITEIEIPDTVTSIDDIAFRHCSRLEEILIPNSVTKIGGNAFYGCGSLKSITIPGGITEIGKNLFDECPLLTDIYYQGSKKDWDKLNSNGDDWPAQNVIPENIQMHFRND